jgi:hypothetical protein
MQLNRIFRYEIPTVIEEAMLSGNVPVNPVKPILEDFQHICRSAMAR